MSNPEAIGNPNLTPIVQLPDALAEFFERTRCPECSLINQHHTDECSRRTWVCDACMSSVTREQIADMADGEHVLCRRCRP